jgi:hypothetical protein
MLAVAGDPRLVPFQSGDCAQPVDLGKYRDRAATARVIKSLSDALGADLTGICDIPHYAWFSHMEAGSEIKPYHRSAVVMLIDQGYDTMRENPVGCRLAVRGSDAFRAA